jgi:outer membrane lipase/esterase
MWSVALGGRLGLRVSPSDAPGGGNNFAAGGARVVFEAENSNAWSTQSQINAYLALTGGRADPNALYALSIGINDLKITTAGGPGNIVNPENVAAITLLGQQAARQVLALAAAGARYILVDNTLQMLTQTAADASGLPISPSQVASRALYDQTLWNTIHAAGVNFIPADFNSVLNFVLLHPASFGITTTNFNTPACGPTVGSINCTPANFVTPNADRTFFFADGPANPSTGGGHLAGAMQQVQADYFYSLITAPSEISFLAEAPIKTRAVVVNSIINQIPLSFGTPGAFHGWVTGDVSWLKMTNNTFGFPDDPGTPVAVTAGFDYRIARDWLVGVAFSGGYTNQTFSLGGGFKHDEFAVSLYTAYRNDPWWVDAIASWGGLRDDVNRQIPLGVTVQPNQGNTNGTNISFAAEGGYNFITALGTAPIPGMPIKAAPAAAINLAHGPVVGIIMQQVRIGSFTETNPLGVPTALSFDSQRRDSAVTELGYQASIDFGTWQPYVKAVWNHELANTDRNVTAALTSIIAPTFFMPAVDLGKNWGTGTVGMRFKFAPNAPAYAAFIAQVGQQNVITYGGQIGLNVAFDWAAPSVATKY